MNDPITKTEESAPAAEITPAAAPAAPATSDVPVETPRMSLSSWYACRKVPAAHDRAFRAYVVESKDQWYTAAAWDALYNAFLTRPIRRTS